MSRRSFAFPSNRAVPRPEAAVSEISGDREAEAPVVVAAALAVRIVRDGQVRQGRPQLFDHSGERTVQYGHPQAGAGGAHRGGQEPDVLPQVLALEGQTAPMATRRDPGP
ncbi:hypothetical protein [Amycolatopsis benzoatilytica]|uniref:hypothetical protein n=1 Tax=Amycolatopsis benzoatilytica TaxID=346045 RepID=UPI0005580530|nr:hypothetical protein [Amycolatopsis benzoatilytica]